MTDTYQDQGAARIILMQIMDSQKVKDIPKIVGAIATFKYTNDISAEDVKLPDTIITAMLNLQHLLQVRDKNNSTYNEQTNYLELSNKLVERKMNEYKIHDGIYGAMENAANNPGQALERLVAVVKKIVSNYKDIDERALREELKPILQSWSWNKPGCKNTLTRIVAENGAEVDMPQKRNIQL